MTRPTIHLQPLARATVRPNRLHRLVIPGLAALLLTATPCRAQSDNILGGIDERIDRFRKGDADLILLGESGDFIPEGTPVRILQTRHAFLFGSNVFMLGRSRSESQNSEYERRFSELFNFATLPFYWWTYERERGRTEVDRIEAMAAWCEENGITTKGHPLAWNFVDPGWLPVDLDEVRDLQMGRTHRIVDHFRGRVEVWDVVNEATDFRREETVERAPILTALVEQLGVGPYLREAFRRAREANPNATLLINDYRVDTDYESRVLSELGDPDGRPLYDAIGLQSHQHTREWAVERIWEVCERFSAYGVPLHFTEVTFLSGEPGWQLRRTDPDFAWLSTPEGEKRQAEAATLFYRVLFSHPSVHAITWWDFSDQGAWQGAPAGLLREDMSPKPSYDALFALIKGEWWTRVATRVGEGGRVAFRGFLGDYRVEVGVEPDVRRARLELGKNGQGPVRMTVR
jgi:endo-1,4-beta-xylanase